MTFLGNLSLRILNSLGIFCDSRTDELKGLVKDLISLVKSPTRPPFKRFKNEMFNIILVLNSLTIDKSSYDELEDYFELMTVLLSYYVELEISSLEDFDIDENNSKVFNRIFRLIMYYFKSNEYNIVKTFRNYLLRDVNFQNIKDDIILRDLFCKLFENLFLPPNHAQKAKENNLEFFSYLYIYKIWILFSGTDENKRVINEQIPSLYSNNPAYAVSRKYITHPFYENSQNVIKSIQERLLKMIKIEDFIKSECSRDKCNIFELDNIDYALHVEWLSNFKKSNSNEKMVEIRNEIIDNHISDMSTLRITQVSDISTIDLQDSHEFDFSDKEIKTSESCSEFKTAENSLESTQSFNFCIEYDTNIHERHDYLEYRQKICRKHANRSCRPLHLPKRLNIRTTLCDKPSMIKIRRVYYILNEAEKNKDYFLNRTIKRKKSGWHEVQNCWVKIKRLDPDELNALTEKKLPLEYFEKKYSENSNSACYDGDDKESIETFPNLNDSSISMEILEETLGSRTYLYCHEIEKTLLNLEKEKSNSKKRAKKHKKF